MNLNRVFFSALLLILPANADYPQDCATHSFDTAKSGFMHENGVILDDKEFVGVNVKNKPKIFVSHYSNRYEISANVGMLMTDEQKEKFGPNGPEIDEVLFNLLSNTLPDHTVRALIDKSTNKVVCLSTSMVMN